MRPSEGGFPLEALWCRWLQFGPEVLRNATRRDVHGRSLLPRNLHVLQVGLVVVEETPIEEDARLDRRTGASGDELKVVGEPGDGQATDAFLPEHGATELLTVGRAAPEGVSPAPAMHSESCRGSCHGRRRGLSIPPWPGSKGARKRTSTRVASAS